MKRPIFSYNRSRPVYAAVALCILMVAVLLAAGCAGQTNGLPVNLEKNASQSGNWTNPTSVVPLGDKELAEQTVADAELQITKADLVIAWFKGNASTRNDIALNVVVTKREVALSYIYSAREEIASGNYLRARIKAQDAFEKANESYYDAMARQSFLLQWDMIAWCPIPTLTFAKIVVAILISTIPALLTALLFSLMKTLPSELIGSHIQRFRKTRFTTVLAGAWILFFSILLSGGIANTQNIRTVPLIASSIWMTLALVIVSLIVIGIVVGNAIRSRITKKTQDHETDDDGEKPFTGKYRVAFLTIMTIVLTFLTLLAIIEGIYIFALSPCM